MAAVPFRSCATEVSLSVEPSSLLLALSRVSAGFPSPAEEYFEGTLDLTALLIKRPKSTFFMRVSGDSMTGAGINDGDLLVIDRAAAVADGCIVVAVIDNEFCVKVFHQKDGRVWLKSANPKYQDIHFSEDSDVSIWGRVLHSITHHCPVPKGGE